MREQDVKKFLRSRRAPPALIDFAISFYANLSWQELKAVELCGRYVKAAMSCKDHAYVDTMMELARQEYSHFSALHALTEKMTSAWEKDDVMHVVWQHDRERLVEHAARVKMMMESR